MTAATTLPVTLTALQQMKARGEKIASLTCYDSSFTRVLESAGVEMFIIGDSLGMVLKGHESTVPVTIADMIYHAANVARVGQSALRVVDMPFMSYANPDQALGNAARLMGEGGAHMVKLEGGADKAAIVEYLVGHSIPVCGHIGLLPQSVHQLGGYKVQGRDEAGARALQEDARALEQAGAGLLVLECVPAVLATRISAAVNIPTIGIGAGPGCDGQVLVLYDMLGITPGKRPRFVRDFLRDTCSVPAAIEAYVAAVKNTSFPAAEHCF
ncbi:MAG: 3-methyl-2-oxobutanoate hydroxymethyltransferase [Gammaproteobacteria bacterium]|nr:3-methyl-2-oxobutanoate hydroxymethyltransferase [Gammaproteobacteria bacterium]